MQYVRFNGSTPHLGTNYEDYLVFEDDAPIELIANSSINYALENAKKFSHFRPAEMARADWTEACLSLATWCFVSKEEFDEAID